MIRCIFAHAQRCLCNSPNSSFPIGGRHWRPLTTIGTFLAQLDTMFTRVGTFSAQSPCSHVLELFWRSWTPRLLSHSPWHVVYVPSTKHLRPATAIYWVGKHCRQKPYFADQVLAKRGFSILTIWSIQYQFNSTLLRPNTAEKLADFSGIRFTSR